MTVVLPPNGGAEQGPAADEFTRLVQPLESELIAALLDKHYFGRKEYGAFINGLPVLQYELGRIATSDEQIIAAQLN